jgi:hypothetical protein
MRIGFVCAVVLFGSGAFAQSVDLRGMDTLGGNGGQAKVQFKGSSTGSNSRLNLSDPRLADTLSGAGNRVSGLCGAPDKAGATVTNCYGLVGPSEPLKGDTLK